MYSPYDASVNENTNNFGHARTGGLADNMQVDEVQTIADGSPSRHKKKGAREESLARNCCHLNVSPLTWRSTLALISSLHVKLTGISMISLHLQGGGKNDRDHGR